MVDILHRVGVDNASPEKVYDTLTTVDGLSGWWTDDTRGVAEVGGVLQFRFPAGGFDMEVVDQRPSEHVKWKVVDGPQEWIGTTGRFERRSASTEAGSCTRPATGSSRRSHRRRTV